MIRSLFTLVFLVSIFISCKENDKKKPSVLEKNIGEQFKITGFIDTAGKPVVPDFSAADINIIDFWNSTCQPCIADMKEFPELLKHTTKKVQIFSVSLNQFWLWQPIVKNATGIFSFYQNQFQTGIN